MRAKKVLLWSFLSIILILLGSLTMINMESAVSANPGGQTNSAIVNGIDMTHVNGLIDQLKEDKTVGRVTFYSNTSWQDGLRSFTTISGYKVDGEMLHEKERQFVLLGDEATELGGTDTAPGAVEELMYAVGTCITAAANLKAALMDVKLTEFELALESDLDLHGLLALDPDVRPGILDMRARITIAGDADEETLKKIAQFGYDYSPVSDSVRNGVSVKPDIVVAKAVTAK